jgi:hypothetical protein
MDQLTDMGIATATCAQQAMNAYAVLVTDSLILAREVLTESEPMTTYSASDIRAARDAANPNRPGCRRARAIQRRTGTHAHPWWKDPHPGQPCGCSLHPSAVALYRARQMAAIARLVRAGLY